MKLEELLLALKNIVIEEFSTELLTDRLKYSIIKEVSNSVVVKVYQTFTFSGASNYLDVQRVYRDRYDVGPRSIFENRVDKVNKLQIEKFKAFCEEHSLLHNMLGGLNIKEHNDFNGNREIVFTIESKFLSKNGGNE